MISLGTIFILILSVIELPTHWRPISLLLPVIGGERWLSKVQMKSLRSFITEYNQTNPYCITVSSFPIHFYLIIQPANIKNDSVLSKSVFMIPKFSSHFSHQLFVSDYIEILKQDTNNQSEPSTIKIISVIYGEFSFKQILSVNYRGQSFMVRNPGHLVHSSR